MVSAQAYSLVGSGAGVEDDDATSAGREECNAELTGTTDGGEAGDDDERTCRVAAAGEGVLVSVVCCCCCCCCNGDEYVLHVGADDSAFDDASGESAPRASLLAPLNAGTGERRMPLFGAEAGRTGENAPPTAASLASCVQKGDECACPPRDA